MERRKIWISYVLLLLGGFFGVHKFYLNRPLWGLAYLLTGGFFCIGLLWDLFTIPSQVRRCNQAMGLEEYPSPRNVTGHAELQRRLALLEAAERVEKLHRRLDDLETLSAARGLRSR